MNQLPYYYILDTPMERTRHAWLPEGCLVIADRSAEHSGLSVTNGAEQVVEDLFRRGKLSSGQRLFYYDSDGNLDELRVRDRHFDGFSPGADPRLP